MFLSGRNSRHSLHQNTQRTPGLIDFNRPKAAHSVRQTVLFTGRLAWALDCFSISLSLCFFFLTLARLGDAIQDLMVAVQKIAYGCGWYFFPSLSLSPTPFSFQTFNFYLNTFFSTLKLVGTLPKK